ncbi:hypothetical protein SDC9_147455 [bioreactor metagenome]|uniref:Uncharacterized protein n=1 Tax=bioreactor metagenome TaxID=1076179 RepID=A0A645EEE0_9ZZZZ
MPHPQVRKRGPLIDAEEHLPGIHGVRQSVQPPVFRDAPLQPSRRPLAGRLRVLVGSGILHALVKGHGDVAAQVGLNLHGFLRPHEDAVPVDVGGEGDALLLNLPQGGQRKHLKPAGVRQNRAVPVHKLMKPAHLAHHLITGAQMQVIGVGKLDLTADLPEVEGAGAALDGSLCAHVHEHRGLNHAAVCAGELAPPRAALIFDDFKHERLLF